MFFSLHILVKGENIDMKNYYKEIENIIVERETNKKIYAYKDNKDTLMSKWNIGKILYEAQGGSLRAKYGTNLIKEWVISYLYDMVIIILKGILIGLNIVQFYQ